MELQIFQNAEFGSVLSIVINDEPYFVGKDVAEILGYADSNKSIVMHVDEDDKLNDKSASSLGQRGGWFINESGLYSLSGNFYPAVITLLLMERCILKYEIRVLYGFQGPVPGVESRKCPGWT